MIPVAQLDCSLEITPGPCTTTRKLEVLGIAGKLSKYFCLCPLRGCYYVKDPDPKDQGHPLVSSYTHSRFGV